MADTPTERVIGGNEFLRYVDRDERLNYRKQEVSQLVQVPDQRGLMFIDLLKAWGMVAAKRGDDTASGNPTLALLEVDQAVARAKAITEAAYKVMEDTGWLIKLDRSEPPNEADLDKT
jgi:hypothetical protein